MICVYVCLCICTNEIAVHSTNLVPVRRQINIMVMVNLLQNTFKRVILKRNDALRMSDSVADSMNLRVVVAATFLWLPLPGRVAVAVAAVTVALLGRGTDFGGHLQDAWLLAYSVTRQQHVTLVTSYRRVDIVDAPVDVPDSFTAIPGPAGVDVDLSSGTTLFPVAAA